MATGVQGGSEGADARVRSVLFWVWVWRRIPGSGDLGVRIWRIGGLGWAWLSGVRLSEISAIRVSRIFCETAVTACAGGLGLAVVGFISLVLGSVWIMLRHEGDHFMRTLGDVRCNGLLSIIAGYGRWCRGVVRRGCCVFVVCALGWISLRGGEPTSFDAVARQLDEGGTFYLYLSTARCLSDLSGKVDHVGDEVMGALREGGLGAGERDRVGAVFRMVSGVVDRSGLELLTGIGMSGVEIHDGLYRTKLFAHRRAGVDLGYGGRLFGREPHPLGCMDLLPEATVYAGFHDVDVAGLWGVIEREVAGSGIEELRRGLGELRELLGRGAKMSVQDLMASFGGEFGVVLTLNGDERVPVPLPSGEVLELDEPRLALVIKVRDDALFGRFEEMMAGSGQEVMKVDGGGLRMRTVEVSAPLPIRLRPTVARVGDYLVLATTDLLVREMSQVMAGERPGLRSAPAFQRVAKGMVFEGNGFGYVDKRLTETIRGVQLAFVDAQLGVGGGAGSVEAAMMGLLQRWLGGQEAVEEVGVSANTAEGWRAIWQGNREPAQAMITVAGVAPTAVLAGMLLPALAKAKSKAQSIACVNNLKQICLGARIYATDHEDVFAPDVSSMEAELFSPRVLFCPEDPMRPDPLPEKWGDVDFDNISYEYLMPGASEVDGFDPRQVMFRCRHHGHVGQADGAVIQSR